MEFLYAVLSLVGCIVAMGFYDVAQGGLFNMDGDFFARLLFRAIPLGLITQNPLVGAFSLVAASLPRHDASASWGWETVVELVAVYGAQSVVIALPVCLFAHTLLPLWAAVLALAMVPFTLLANLVLDNSNLFGLMINGKPFIGSPNSWDNLFGGFVLGAVAWAAVHIGLLV